MKNNLILCISLVLALLSCKEEPIVEYQVIPQPQSITYQNGFMKLKNKITVAYPAALQGEAELLQSFLNDDFKIETEFLTDQTKGTVILTVDENWKPEKEGGYQMNVGKNIQITSNNSEGVLNGIQTLRQIITGEGDKFKVQKATITDYPAFTWRAFMLDEGRNFHGMEVVKGLLDEMSLMKLNIFHWHLTEDQGWRIEIKKYPKLTEIGACRDSTELGHFGSNVFDGKPVCGFYTQEQIKEIVAYASQRHIMIIPEVEMPGHSSAAIAAYPWLGVNNQEIKVPCSFGVKADAYNVSDPNVIQFLQDVVDEVIALFPGSVFHIGGDEVMYDQWKASKQVQDYMKANNLNTQAELQIFFTNNMSNYISQKGKRMMGWNEITGEKIHSYQNEGDNTVGQKLAESTIVQYWHGDIKNIKNTIEKGYDVVNSFNNNTYINYDYKAISLEKAYSFNPIPENLPAEMHHKILGLGCQVWGEFTPTDEILYYQTFPRIAAYAEVGWTKVENKDYARFQSALTPLLKRWEAKGYQYGPVNPEEPAK